MDFDFALILTVATLVAGLICLADLLLFKQHKSPKALAQMEGIPPREHVIIEYAYSFFPVLAVVWVLRSFLFGLSSPSFRQGGALLGGRLALLGRLLPSVIFAAWVTAVVLIGIQRGVIGCPRVRFGGRIINGGRGRKRASARRHR